MVRRKCCAAQIAGKGGRRRSKALRRWKVGYTAGNTGEYNKTHQQTHTNHLE
jgi:hypothetical protein